MTLTLIIHFNAVLSICPFARFFVTTVVVDLQVLHVIPNTDVQYRTDQQKTCGNSNKHY